MAEVELSRKARRRTKRDAVLYTPTWDQVRCDVRPSKEYPRWVAVVTDGRRFLPIELAYGSGDTIPSAVHQCRDDYMAKRNVALNDYAELEDGEDSTVHA